MNATVEIYENGRLLKTRAFQDIESAKLYADRHRDWFGYWTLLIY